MSKQEHIEYWLKIAAHDWELVEHLFESGRYDWCLYHAHLVLEKTIKAFWVRDSDKRVPHIHKLVELAKGTRLELSDEQKQYLADIANFDIEGRYPDYKLEFYKLCTKEFTTEHLEKIRTFYLWLLSQIASAPSSTSSSNNSTTTT
jgi:HEPN domain-containing protein